MTGQTGELYDLIARPFYRTLLVGVRSSADSTLVNSNSTQQW